MKSYTDLGQSKKLAEILPLESADMIWYGTYCGMDSQYHLLSGEYNEFGLIAINKEFCKTLFRLGDEHVDWLPCWSLAALLDILPHGKALIHDKGNLGYKCICNNIDTYFHNNPVDACVELIVKLKEENLL